MLDRTFRQFLDYFTRDRVERLIVVAAILVAGLLLIRLLSAVVGRISRRRLSQQYGMLLRKAISYTGAAVVLIIVLQLLGVKIGALLGAAGIVGIAIGFASQTSMSNLISGLFLISEKPFQVGDVIRVGGNTGIIQSIDLLSVKVRTFDNLFIRIPNEILIKGELTNITRYPIRRLDVKLSVAYKTEVGKVMEVLKDLAAANPYCLDEPEPLILFTEFGDSGLQFLYGLWFHKPDFLSLKNSIMREIKERFEAEGIEIPFPHVSLYAGSASDPFPVRVVADEGGAALPGSGDPTATSSS